MYAYYCAPMTMSPLPSYVDARKIFTQKGVISGSMELQRLEQICKSLADLQGEVSARIAFTVDESGSKLITGDLQATVNVYCQRCLEPLAIELKDAIELILVPDEESAAALDKSLDPWIADNQKIDIVRLIDEQLVLCMPIVILHDTGPCASDSSFSTEQGLAGLGKPELNDAQSQLASLLTTLKKT